MMNQPGVPKGYGQMSPFRQRKNQQQALNNALGGSTPGYIGPPEGTGGGPVGYAPPMNRGRWQPPANPISAMPYVDAPPSIGLGGMPPQGGGMPPGGGPPPMGMQPQPPLVPGAPVGYEPQAPWMRRRRGGF